MCVKSYIKPFSNMGIDSGECRGCEKNRFDIHLFGQRVLDNIHKVARHDQIIYTKGNIKLG